MSLVEEIEHGKITKGRMRYKRYMKKRNIRIWRRFKEELKPMYNRFRGWEF